MIKAYELKVGSHRGNKRVWIESQKILKTDLAENMSFSPIYDIESKKIVLEAGDTHRITMRKTSKRGIIDINNSKISEIFGDTHAIVVKIFKDKIEISPSKEDIEQLRAEKKSNNNTPTFIEVFAGGGTLVKSLNDAGLKPVAAIELEDKYLENTEANNPELFTYCGDLSRLDLSLLPDADIVSGGIPCEGFSKSQLAKSRKESHPTGSLGYFFLKVVDYIRPSVVLIEEVPDFGNSSMGAMARYVLRSMGYHISETELVGTEKGSLAKRKRYCMVASIKKPFEFKKDKLNSNKKIIDILEIPLKERVWLTKENSKTIAYSLKKEKEHIKKGDGFRIGRTRIDDVFAVTITKGYYKNRLTDPILVHPENENMYSWFTPRELARINGLPEDFILPGGKRDKTKSGEIIGQGICYESFYSLGLDIKKHFLSTTDEDKNLFDFVEEVA